MSSTSADVKRKREEVLGDETGNVDGETSNSEGSDTKRQRGSERSAKAKGKAKRSSSSKREAELRYDDGDDGDDDYKVAGYSKLGYEKQSTAKKYPNELREMIASISTTKDMRAILEHEDFKKYCRSEKEVSKGDTVYVWDKMQKDYVYTLDEEMGKNYAEGFEPKLTPKEMLSMGVFEGKYLNDCLLEFPREWYEEALQKGKLRPGTPAFSINYFNIKSRQPLEVWREKKWSPLGGLEHLDADLRGWFQWYCRYYMGRRLPDVDRKQIQRWRSFRRHEGQVKKNCEKGDCECRPRQRQALLQWAYDPLI